MTKSGVWDYKKFDSKNFSTVTLNLMLPYYFILSLYCGNFEVSGLLTCSKNFKAPFLKDVKIFFHKATQSLKSHHLFFFKYFNISGY